MRVTRTIYIPDSVTKTCPFKSIVDLRREMKAVNADEIRRQRYAEVMLELNWML